MKGRRLISLLFAAALTLWPLSAQEAVADLQENAAVPAESAESEEADGLDIAGIIFGHIGDAYEWHITDIGHKAVAIHLPVIVRSKTSGWHCFSSRRLEHGGIYEGFFISGSEKNDGKVVELVDGQEVRPFDISITKNVLSLMISSALLALVVLLVARWYRRHDALNEAPTGLAALMEPLIMMVHNMARDNIGEDYKRYSPYLCTAFLFILFNNFIGIIPFFPGGANLTGNIAVTLVLALCTFFAVNLFGNKHYYKELFLPDVPGFLKPIMPVIEVFSALVKPMSLTIRLFANMLAGHIMILCMVCIIFVMAKYGAVVTGSISVISVLFGLFLDLLECLVAFIQAYVFTMLSSIYIGLSRQKE